MVGAHVMVEESGAPIMLVVRLKVVDNKLTEIELVPTRSRADGLIFNLDGLKAASAVMNYAPRADELATREEVLKAALKYPEGFTRAETFAAVNAPFAPDAYRYENGQIMAGPDCKFSPDCKNISTQSLAIFKRLGAPMLARGRWWMSAWASRGCAWPGACARKAATSSPRSRRSSSTAGSCTRWRRSSASCRSRSATAGWK